METAIVLLVIAGLILLATRKTLKLRKAGGCAGCSGCAMKDQCSKEKKFD